MYKLEKPLKPLIFRDFENEAGSENRTRINSLEGYGFTTKLCPQDFGAKTVT